MQYLLTMDGAGYIIIYDVIGQVLFNGTGVPASQSPEKFRIWAKRADAGFMVTGTDSGSSQAEVQN